MDEIELFNPPRPMKLMLDEDNRMWLVDDTGYAFRIQKIPDQVAQAIQVI